MDATALRAMQAPIKERYKSAPETALITLELVEAIIGKEYRGRVDAGRDVDLQLAALRHALDGLVDDRGLR
jgi:hypothetical protein